MYNDIYHKFAKPHIFFIIRSLAAQMNADIELWCSGESFDQLTMQVSTAKHLNIQTLVLLLTWGKKSSFAKLIQNGIIEQILNMPFNIQCYNVNLCKL